MIRIILKESKYGLSNREYGFKNIRFLEKIKRLTELLEILSWMKVRLLEDQNPEIGELEWGKITEIKEKFLQELWLDIISQIKVLEKENIIKTVGFGSLGGAFLLTNGNILKVGLDSDGSNPELDWLKNSHVPHEIKKDHFSGKGTSSELHVYDSGVLEFPWREIHPTIGPWSWREVPRYTMFLQFLQEEGLESAEHEVAYIANDIDIFLREYSRQLDRIPNFNSFFLWFYKKKFHEYYLLQYLKEEQVRKLIKAIYDITLRRENLKDDDNLDLKADNLGVDQHGNFVFFDF